MPRKTSDSIDKPELDPDASRSDETKNESLAAIAYRRIRDSIAQSELKPGARLVDREISKRFMIGRTPVREALQRLESEGSVARVPSLGLVVPQLDEKNGLELAFIREELEGMAAYYSARTADPIEIDLMARLIDEERRVVDDRIAMREINRRLHNTIYFSGRNRLLAKTLISLRNSMLFLPTTLMVKGRAQKIHSEHCEIVTAIAARDPVRAESAMRNHIRLANIARTSSLVI